METMKKIYECRKERGDGKEQIENRGNCNQEYYLLCVSSKTLICGR